MKQKTMQKYLIMRMPLQCKLLVPLSIVKKRLSNYPNMELIREGTSLTYSFLENNDNAEFCIILSKNSIIMNIRANITPVRYEKDAVLRLVSIVMILDGFYHIEARNMLPYMVSTLARHNVEYYAEKARRMQLDEETSIKGTEIILSKRILGLMSEISSKTEMLSHANKKFDDLVEKIVDIECSYGPFSIEEICLKYGLSANDVKAHTEAKTNCGASRQGKPFLQR